MFFDSLHFKAIESGIQALSIKQQIITQNLANMETPNYKQQHVEFRNVLEDASAAADGKNKRYDFQASVITDRTTNINVDGNNVDTDQQSLELYSTYLQHSALVEKMNSHFSKLRTVLNSGL
ncbi:MAG: flagellar basal body rod protein FlgB [Oscillospiraceae bacterium]|jgi:flagellar basal-body rod protein FlgB|nr:flagellar basal body rod protein FlgB [Oscillospiraceae bacterium]